MKLITEGFSGRHLADCTKDEKNLYLEGIYIQTECGNKNGRFYPKGNILQEMDRYLNERINASQGYGELKHPDHPEVDEDRIAHRMTSLDMSGNDFIGKSIVTTDTPCGKIVEGLLKTGGIVGVSSRALGSLKERSDGLMEVLNDYHFCAQDIVLNPSAPDAFVNGIMESMEWIYESGVYKAVDAEKAHDAIKNAPKRQIKETINEHYMKFITTVAKNSINYKGK